MTDLRSLNFTEHDIKNRNYAVKGNGGQNNLHFYLKFQRSVTTIIKRSRDIRY